MMAHIVPRFDWLKQRNSIATEICRNKAGEVKVKLYAGPTMEDVLV